MENGKMDFSMYLLRAFKLSVLNIWKNKKIYRAFFYFWNYWVFYSQAGKQIQARMLDICT